LQVFGTNVSVPLFTQLLAFVGTKDVDNAGREVQVRRVTRLCAPDQPAPLP
jgi:hypothetical protein